jgi:8-oxo-dGTP pyrophosphatase MutT (NUDIX family)
MSEPSALSDALAGQRRVSLGVVMASNTRDRVQFAALPCRIGESGQPQVLLLTSRETRRWVIPKGWPVKGLKPREVAAREAYEEAGLLGTITSKDTIGVYHYEKQLPTEQFLCEVWVFQLWVTQQLDDWPEKSQRETRWFDMPEAAALVDEGGLAEIVRLAFAPIQPQRPRCDARVRIPKLLPPRRLR